MHLMVLGASRRWRSGLRSWLLYGLNAPDGAGCFPTLGVLSVVPPGKRAPDRHWPESALGPNRTPLIEPDFAQVSQGSPPTDLLGLRATRCRRGHADPAAVPCSSNTSVQTRATNREALARRPPGGRRRASSQDWAPQPFPLGEATTVPPQGPWWPGWWVWPAWRGRYRRDRVVSMEIASLMRRPRVRVTDVIGSEPIAWNSLSVKLPAGA